MAPSGPVPGRVVVPSCGLGNAARGTILAAALLGVLAYLVGLSALGGYLGARVRGD